MRNLRVVQLYEGGGKCPAPLCENCHGNRAKMLCATPENKSVDLCFKCAEEADISDRWPIENYDELVPARVAAKKNPLTYFTQWEGLRGN